MGEIQATVVVIVYMVTTGPVARWYQTLTAQENNDYCKCMCVCVCVCTHELLASGINKVFLTEDIINLLA